MELIWFPCRNVSIPRMERVSLRLNFHTGPAVLTKVSSEYFNEYAEQLEAGETSETLSHAAKKNEVYLIGGSFPERRDGKLYNTCTVWGPDGGLLAVHRKVPVNNQTNVIKQSI